jgi:hypothetical protein
MQNKEALGNMRMVVPCHKQKGNCKFTDLYGDPHELTGARIDGDYVKP